MSKLIKSFIRIILTVTYFYFFYMVFAAPSTLILLKNLIAAIICLLSLDGVTITATTTIDEGSKERIWNS